MTVFRIMPAALAALLLIGDFSSAQPPEGRPRRERALQDEGGQRGPRDGRAGGPPRSLIIIALDVDSDGEISAAELENAVAALKKLDKDNDGKLTFVEYQGEGRRGRGGFAGGDRVGEGGGRFGGGPTAFIDRIMESDKDADGKLSKEELPARMQDRFETIDADSDGYVSKKELEETFTRLGGARRGGGGPTAFIDRIMEGDKDADGKLSKEELPARMQDRFETIDADSDGYVSKKELEETFARLGGARRGGGGPGPGGQGDRPQRPQRPE